MLIQHPDLHILTHCTILHTVYFSFWSRLLFGFLSSVQGFKVSAPHPPLYNSCILTHIVQYTRLGRREFCMKSRLCAVRHKHKAQRWWQAVASCVLMRVLCSRSVKIQTWERSYDVSCPHSGHRHCAYPLLTIWSHLIIDPWIPNTPLNNIVPRPSLGDNAVAADCGAGCVAWDGGRVEEKCYSSTENILTQLHSIEPIKSRWQTTGLEKKSDRFWSSAT